MNPGELNKKIKILKILPRNPLKNESLEIFLVRFAKVKNVSENEYEINNSIKSKIKKVVIIRYKKELDPSYDFSVCQKYKIQYRNQIYNILSIKNINEQNKYLEFEVSNI